MREFFSRHFSELIHVQFNRHDTETANTHARTKRERERERERERA